MKIRGQRYSFIGTLCALIAILIMFFLNKYVFKPSEKIKDAQLPTESTYQYPTVEAQIGILPGE